MVETALIVSTPSIVEPRSDTTALIDSFLAGRSVNTINAYRRDLKDFCIFLAAASINDAVFFLVSRGHGNANALALAYRNRLVERGLAAATVNRRLAALRSLVSLARTVGMITWTLDVSGVKTQPYRDTRGPGFANVKRLLAHTDERTDTKGVRDRALVSLLADLALRREEAVSLDREHLDLVAGAVSIMGKGRTGRETLTLPETTRAALTAWLDVRGDRPGPLFVNLDRARKGGRLTGRSVHRIVGRLGTEIGVTVRPHGLRHTAITRALDLTGGDVRRVVRYSRHADARVLLRYDDARRDDAGEIAKLVAVR
jgi:integrase/recombinase XerC